MAYIDIDKYKEDTQKILELLFKKAEDKNPEKFLRSFFAIEKDRYKYKGKKISILNYIPDIEFNEIRELTKFFLSIKDIDKKNITRIHLILYFHIIEADFPYIVIANLGRTVIGDPYDTRIFFYTETGKRKIAEYPYQKINYFKDLGSKIEINLGSIFNAFYNRELRNLRNAFIHSQYTINKNGDVFITRLVSPTSKESKKKFNELYEYEKIENVFFIVFNFLEVLYKLIKISLSKFKTGECYSIGNDIGKIKFDLSLKDWIFCQSRNYIIKPKVKYHCAI